MVCSWVRKQKSSRSRCRSRQFRNHWLSQLLHARKPPTRVKTCVSLKGRQRQKSYKLAPSLRRSCRQAGQSYGLMVNGCRQQLTSRRKIVDDVVKLFVRKEEKLQKSRLSRPKVNRPESRCRQDGGGPSRRPDSFAISQRTSIVESFTPAKLANKERRITQFCDRCPPMVEQ